MAHEIRAGESCCGVNNIHHMCTNQRTAISAVYIVEQKIKTMIWHEPEISGGVFEVLL
jgi:hypothetical protein